MTSSNKEHADFKLRVFELKEGVTNFTEKDVEYYRAVKGIDKDTTIIVKRNDGKQDWY